MLAGDVGPGDWVLGQSLGVALIDIRSKGYGSCRIVPTAVLADREDFEDSAKRLVDILDACFPDRALRS